MRYVLLLALCLLWGQFNEAAGEDVTGAETESSETSEAQDEEDEWRKSNLRQIERVKREVEHRTERHGPNAASTLYAKLDLAWRLMLVEELEESLSLYEEVIAASDGVLERDDSQYLDALRNPASIYVYRGDTDKAIELHQMRIERHRPDDHNGLAWAKGDLALLHSQLGNYAEALDLNEQVLQHRILSDGPDAPNTVIAMGNLGNSLMRMSRFQEAELQYRNALEVVESTVRLDAQDAVQPMLHLGIFYRVTGRYAEAAPLLERALELSQTYNRESVWSTVFVMEALADLYARVGRNSDANQLYQQVFQIRKRELGPEAPQTLLARLSLIRTTQEAGQIKDAAEQLRDLVEQMSTALSPKHPHTLRAKIELARNLSSRSQFDEAKRLMQSVLETQSIELGPNHSDTLATLNDLGQLSTTLGEFETAEDYLRRAMASYEATVGSDNPDFIYSQNNLALLYRRSGRIQEAEALMRKSFAYADTVWAPDSPDTLWIVESLGNLLAETEKFKEAELLLQRAFQSQTQNFGPDHLRTLATASSLGAFYLESGRVDAALPILERTTAALEELDLQEHDAALIAYSELARAYHLSGRFDTAEFWFQRDVEVSEQLHGTGSVIHITALNNAALFYYENRLFERARDLYMRALELSEQVEVTRNMYRRTISGSLGATLVKLKEYELAEDLLLGIQTSAAEFSGQPRASALVDRKRLADLYFETGRISEAELMMRSVMGALHKRLRDSPAAVSASRDDRWTDRSGGMTEGGYQDRYLEMVAALGESASQDALNMALISSQFGRSEAAANALQAASTRLTVADATIAQNVRELTDLREQVRGLEISRTEAFADDRLDIASALGDKIVTVSGALDQLNEKIALAFPEYAALASPSFVTLDDLQGVDGLLEPGEALILFVQSEETLTAEAGWYTMMVRDDRSRLIRLELDPGVLTEQIEQLRKSAAVTPSGLPAFDLQTANDLYRSFISPLEPDLSDIDRLLVVPDGPLLSLPLELLAVRIPDQPIGDEEALQRTTWLNDRFSVSVLPAVSSLRSLRKASGQSSGDRALIAFADPKLSAPETRPGVQALMSLSAADAFETVCDLPEVPATRRIAASLSRALGSQAGAVIQGAAATEAEIRRLNETGTLSRARVVAFNTHGLTASEVGDRLGEPALALTPAGGCGTERPLVSDTANDGFLTVSEVVELNLDADWVLLTACNTAAADGEPGAEPLSGLARGFFYAGARALLVSHWPAQVSADPLVDGPTEMLMSELFAAERAFLPKSEALRQAQSIVRDTYPHPAHWAAFSLIGDGR